MTATPFTTALANARQAATETGNGVGRAALTPPATNGGPDVVVWFVDGATVVDEHPLRRILPRELVMDGGIDTAFFLLVREDRGAVEQSGAVVTAVACHHAGTDADSRGRVSVTVDTRVLQPLQIDDARHWLSEYVTTVPSANTALFAWCAEADGQRRCFMAAVPEVNERGEASAKNEVDRSRAWWLLDQRVDAIDTTSKASATVFDDALDGRLYADPFESLGAPPTKAMFQLTFDILNDDDMVMADDGDVDAERCRIGFSAEWTEPTPLSADAAIDVLAKHAPSSARSQLSVRAVHGSRDLDNLPATASTLKELINLDKLQMMRDKTRPVARWFGTTGTNVGASANVRAFVEEIIQNGGGIGSGMATTKSDAADAWNSLPQRQDHDFTELFWTFAQGALGQDDLIEALTAVAEELETGRLQPLVHRTNQTQLAALIRDCLRLAKIKTSTELVELQESIARHFDYWLEKRGDMDGDGDDEQVPANDNVEMEPLPVLDLMIEVGVGKLRRDYASWLIGNNLLTAAQFDEIFDAHLPPADQIRRLHYLHRLIEVWSLIRQNVLCLPFENLRSCIQEAFSFWRDVVVREDDENHAISFDATVNFLYSFPQFASGSAQVLQTIQRSFQPVEIRAILSCTDDDATETGSSRVIDMIYSRRDMTDYAGFNAKCASAVDVPITATDVDRYHMHLATWDRQAFASVANE